MMVPTWFKWHTKSFSWRLWVDKISNFLIPCGSRIFLQKYVAFIYIYVMEIVHGKISLALIFVKGKLLGICISKILNCEKYMYSKNNIYSMRQVLSFDTYSNATMNFPALVAQNIV